MKCSVVAGRFVFVTHDICLSQRREASARRPGNLKNTEPRPEKLQPSAKFGVMVDMLNDRTAAAVFDLEGVWLAP